jgi:hypothetical protein
MPFTLIKGTFHVVGYSPDGDSVRFQAADNSNWDKLSGPKVALNAKGHAQLRFEAIDALETHFMDHHQPEEWAQKALEFTLSSLGITGVQWNQPHTRVVAANDGVDGYIVTRAAERNHRPISFVYSGTTDEADGSSINLDVARMQDCVNYKLLQTGLAYPTYYRGLFPDLRNAMTSAVQDCRQNQVGIFGVDRTNVGFVVQGLSSITEDSVILPKLFRRLVEYLEGGGSVGGFLHFMEAKAEEIVIISTGHATHFDTIIDVQGQTVRLTVPPEDIMFME